MTKERSSIMNPKNQQATKPQFSGYKLNGSKVASSTDPRWWNNDPIAIKNKPAIDIEDMRVLSMVGALGGGMDRCASPAK